MTALAVEGLVHAFGGLRALDGLSLAAEVGERLVILGPNGAGKTTLFNCITGVLPINAGAVYLDGRLISKRPPNELVHLGMARTFQKNNLFNNLTVEENIHLAIAARKPYRLQMLKSLRSYAEIRRETDELLGQWELGQHRDVPVHSLSYGEQRLLEFLLALASKPRILLLDEPTSGMSPAETAQTAEVIRQLPRSVTLLVIEHDMDVVFSIADRLTVLHHGEVMLSGTPDEVRNSELVREIYFGGAARADA
ncbi:MAG: ABC transporter ATP-binding protein [Alicyclobacillus sp.]|nr:ABC transporter ATP-binding protein [Alicyclobacillus sp.]